MKKTAKIGPDFKLSIKELMNQYLGIIRTERGLEAAKNEIDKFSEQFEDGIHLINAESRNITDVAKLIIDSASMRKESRGLHYIQEYPKKDRRFLKNTVLKKGENG